MGETSDRELERLFDLDNPAGPARPIDATRSAAIVAAALRGAGFPPGGGGGRGGAATGAKSAIATKLALVASGAVLAIGATAWLLVRTPAAPVELPAPAPAPVAPPAEPPPAAAPASAAVAPLASEPATEPASEPATEPASDDEAAPEPPEPPAPARPRQRPRGHARVEAPRTPAEASDLLARANAARMAHDWRAADALYRRVARGGGGDGLAAQTALVASAELHLEHLGDPAGAARRFRAALAGGAGEALAEDARWGLAESARATGDAAAERRALDDFLAHHPASARAERARTRRAELGAAR